MKLLTVICLITLFAPNVFANRAPLSQWTCYAEGEDNPGGPGGPIWETVSGVGATQFEAADNALQSCLDLGLQMCLVNDCLQSP